MDGELVAKVRDAIEAELKAQAWCLIGVDGRVDCVDGDIDTHAIAEAAVDAIEGRS
ncbi:hypothetical protein SEA_BOOSTSEASON_70 [Mycobacterium phage BoostSeason]|uniref:Uncharacterized protein n=2 Tax=Timquatrovirus TaxID=1623306 RepID=Q9ZX12_BPMT4|nr:hypothetical protein TM4_gp68 [Mycobacterium phage TM4]YP_009195316.1 hypothetical protein SEA_MUFASA_70 [Mycobacterium phage Mufasa]AGK85693.1 hypothetical protein 33D_0011 [Mycobacterium phage 33D]AYN57243.1 hypothetical protein SEA_BOOSTSEASON_70 [Mycobacterium phage BoostSeason]AAD17633.1 hypothetical protein TM4_68 [Mycobacterium phage TM4]ALF00504.1 hypothetical protein SEA_MUFASA_70 [Mycobacterium phage Mufasa]